MKPTNAVPSQEAAPPELARLSSELRALRTPSVNAADIEAALFARLQREPKPRSRWYLRAVHVLPVGAVLAAAAAALLAFRGSPPTHEAPLRGPAPVVVASVTPSGEGPEEGAGKVLRAGAAELRVTRDGLATLVLEPGGAARIIRDDGVLAVDLERGALRAYVVPRAEAERVVVTSQGVRVAVHGTVFRVARVDDGTELDVLRGAVSVRGGDGLVQLVNAPRGVLADGTGLHLRSVRSFVELAGPWIEGRSRASGEGKGEPSASARAGEEVGPRGQSTPPGEPSLRAGEDGVGKANADPASRAGREATLRARAVAAANECFQAETTRLAVGVDVRVDAAMTVTVAEGGRVSTVTFATPLAPTLEACIGRSLTGERGPVGELDVNVALARR